MTPWHSSNLVRLTWTLLLWPLILTLSATTETSQNKVNLSSGRSPLASSSKKSRRINFLKPQSLPWKRNVLRDSVLQAKFLTHLNKSVGSLRLHCFCFFTFCIENTKLKLCSDFALVARNLQGIRLVWIFLPLSILNRTLSDEWDTNSVISSSFTK